MSATIALSALLSLFAFLLFLLLTAGELRCRQLFVVRDEYRARHRAAVKLLREHREQFLSEEQAAAEELKAAAVAEALTPPEPTETENGAIEPPELDTIFAEIRDIADSDPMAIARAIRLMMPAPAEEESDVPLTEVA